MNHGTELVYVDVQMQAWRKDKVHCCSDYMESAPVIISDTSARLDEDSLE